MVRTQYAGLMATAQSPDSVMCNVASQKDSRP